MKRLVSGAWFLTITEASARAVKGKRKLDQPLLLICYRRSRKKDVHDLKPSILKPSIMLVSLLQWFPFYQAPRVGTGGYKASGSGGMRVSLFQGQKRSLLLR
jgi:hypothetical protein